MMKQRQVLLAKPTHWEPELKKTTSWTTADQAKDKPSSPNPLVKALQRGRHWVWGPNHRRAIIKSKA